MLLGGLRRIGVAALVVILAAGPCAAPAGAGPYVTQPSSVRWNDVTGVRWSDASGLTFGDLQTGNPADLDLEMLNVLSTLPNTSAIDVVVTYRHYPTAVDLAALSSIGITGGTIFHRLPMVMVNATKQQIGLMANNPQVRSIYANRRQRSPRPRQDSRQWRSTFRVGMSAENRPRCVKRRSAMTSDT